MKNIRHSIEINASKEKVWDVLWGDQTLRDWASIIDEGTYMDGTLQEGNEIRFLSSVSGYGVASRVEKLIPYKHVSLRQISDIKVGKDGVIEERAKQWTGGMESYELEESNGKVTLSVTQDTPEELVEYFEKKLPQALERLKVLAETKEV